jgi:hypothetical protein
MIKLLTISFVSALLAMSNFVHAVDSQGRIIIVPLGTGFDSTVAATPVGGNFKKTVGEQRLEVFEHAAFMWSTILDLDYDITVEVSFTALSCSPGSATLGYAGPNRVAKRNNVWYGTAQANQIDKADTSGANNDIYADFNSSIDDGCYSGASQGWYYGLDNNEPADQEMLLDVVLHEIGHGLGFLSFVDGDTGALFSTGDGSNAAIDSYSQHLYDNDDSKYWSDMTDAERLASNNDNTLVWTGTHGTSDAASKGYSTGIENGDIKIHAPTSYSSGSSISHISTTFSPNQLMEPYNTDDGVDPDLEIAMFKDMGYKLKSELAGNSKPVANSYPVDVLMNTSVDLDHALNLSDADGDAIHFWKYTNKPSNGTISDMYDGNATYTPDTNFTGTDTINWLVYDDNMTVSAEGTITINVIDNSPTPPANENPEPDASDDSNPVGNNDPDTSDQNNEQTTPNTSDTSDTSNSPSSTNTEQSPAIPQTVQPVGQTGGGAIFYLLSLITGLVGFKGQFKGGRHE